MSLLPLLSLAACGADPDPPPPEPPVEVVQPVEAAGPVVVFDRAEYRPGDVLRVRVVDPGPVDDPTAETPPSFTVVDPQGEILVSVYRPLEPEGASASIDLPAGIPGGVYGLRIRLRGAALFRPFEVEGGERPRIDKELALRRSAYEPGDEVTASLSLARPGEGPLADHPVEVLVRVAGDALPRFRARTDAEGTAAIAFRLPRDLQSDDVLLTALVEAGGWRESIARVVPIRLGPEPAKAPGPSKPREAPKRGGWFRLGDPIVIGPLRPEQIREALEPREPRFRYCLQSGLREDPYLSGRVAVAVTIGPEGSIQHAEVSSSTLDAPEAEACLLRHLGEVAFPRPIADGVVVATIPFVFAPGYQGPGSLCPTGWEPEIAPLNGLKASTTEAVAPLTVDLLVPDQVSVGDHPMLPVLLASQAGEALDVTLTATATATASIEEPPEPLTLAAGGRATTLVPVQVSQARPAEVIVSAHAGGTEGTVRRTLDVVPRGFVHTWTEGGALETTTTHRVEVDEPHPGSVVGEVTVYPGARASAVADLLPDWERGSPRTGGEGDARPSRARARDARPAGDEPGGRRGRRGAPRDQAAPRGLLAHIRL